MKTDQSIKLVLDPERLERERFRTTFLYQALIDEGATPVKWKGGQPPKDRDATEKDLAGPVRVRVTDNVIEAVW
jgi:hypothetical protein